MKTPMIAQLQRWTTASAWILGFALGLQSSTAAAADHTGEGRVHEAKAGVSIVPPPDWSRARDTEQLLLVHKGGSATTLFEPNMNITVVRDTGETLQQAAKRAQRDLPKILTGWRLVEEGPIKIDGKDAYFMSGRFRQGTITVRNLQYFLRGSGKRAYLLTFTTTDMEFPKIEEALRKSASTLRVD